MASGEMDVTGFFDLYFLWLDLGRAAFLKTLHERGIGWCGSRRLVRFCERSKPGLDKIMQEEARQLMAKYGPQTGEPND